MLGIDVEALALQLAMGVDPWADQDDDVEMEHRDENSALRTDKRRTNVSSSFQTEGRESNLAHSQSSPFRSLASESAPIGGKAIKPVSLLRSCANLITEQAAC